MFGEIINFIKNYSYGNCFIRVKEYNHIRYGLVLPQNYYFYNIDKVLYMLVPPSYTRHISKCYTLGTLTAKFTSTSKTLSCRHINYETFIKLFEKKNYSTFFLFDDPEKQTLENIINRCFLLGIFQIN